MLTDARVTATLLLMLNYDEASILDVISEMFPGADHARAIELAKESKSRFESDMQAALDTEAIQEEHRVG